MVYIVPLAGFLIGLAPGYYLARQGQTWAVAAFALAGLAAGVWAVLEGRSQSEGWDAIGYGIFAMLMIAPVVVGLVLGGIAGLVMRGRAGQEAAHDRDPS